MDIKNFVGNLTLCEKAKLVHGNGAWHTNAVKDLPSIMMTDGPHGLRKQSDNNSGINDSAKATCFPTASAVATSWNVRNAAKIGEHIAYEAISENVSVVLGPGVNIKRSPLCGRNFEYFSEDPLLAGELAASFVSALQNKGVGCSLKHFAANSQETRRMTINAVVDERALREIYLAAFENVVKNARPYTIMASYNKINAVSATQNKRILCDILRKEWGFDGLVMSDWGASYDMGASIANGMDLEMPDGGEYHEAKLINAVANGTLDERDLDRACYNVVNLVDKCNVVKDAKLVDYAIHHGLCREISADCAVLLKNDGLLPLNTSDEVLVVGELAEKPRFQGAGSSHINTTCKSFLQVLDDNNVKYAYVKGYSVYGDNADSKLEKEAVEAAGKYKTVLFFGGLTDDFEGEGYDRSKLDIPSCQQSLLNKLAKKNDNIAFVMFGGSPVVMPWLDNVKALLHMYLGGEAVTEGAFDLVFGKVSPSGRLAETYPLKLSDTPCYNYFNNDRFVDEHRESIFVGYRYYNTFDVPVQFPFGYGLSYSEFKYDNLKVDVQNDLVKVSVDVANVGNVAASEVVQIYVDNCDCGFMRAKRELRAFDKVFLQAGEKSSLNFELTERAFSIFTDGRFVKVAGDYTVSVCENVNKVILSQKINVSGEKVCGRDKELYPSYFEKGDTFEIDQEQFLKLAKANKTEYKLPKRGEYTLLNTFEDMSEKVGLIRFVIKQVTKMAIKQSPSKSVNDPVAQMIIQGSLTTPLISMMSIGGVPAKYVMFLYYHANKCRGKALKALLGKYSVE